MGKQTRYVITKQMYDKFVLEIISVIEKYDLIAYSQVEKKVLTLNELINPSKMGICFNLISVKNKQHMDYFLKTHEGLSELINLSLEISCIFSTALEIFNFERLWIDNSQYYPTKTNLYCAYMDLKKFISKTSLGYNKEYEEWMLFDDNYKETYLFLRNK